MAVCTTTYDLMISAWCVHDSTTHKHNLLAACLMGDWVMGWTVDGRAARNLCVKLRASLANLQKGDP